MKEYLNLLKDGSYELSNDALCEDSIEVPDGAAYYAEDSNLGIKRNYFFRFFDDAIWIDSQWMRASFLVSNQKVLWVRPTHPEPLPFIDDNPQSLNDQYAEIEQVRQNQKTIDAMHEAEGIFSDKQLKGVEATLSERQSTYGSFVGVANTTGQLMGVIKNSANGQTLPYAHEEALHMICSKIARIVNGDCNHKDSWHDIGGYAKLIENLIEGE